MQFQPPVIAHRGVSAQAPENTLAAFSKAHALGLSWIEFDVMLTASNDVVVIHDETLNRTTTGSGPVIQYPYAFIKTLDAGSWFHSSYQNERVSTLANVLAFVTPINLAVNIELKALSGYEELLVEHVLSCVQTYPHLTILLSSFSRKVLKLLAEKSHLPLGFLMDTWQPDWQDFCEKISAESVCVRQSLLTPARVAAINATQRAVLAYTVDDPVRAKLLYAYGVAAVFSNCPDFFLNSLSRN